MAQKLHSDDVCGKAIPSRSLRPYLICSVDGQLYGIDAGKIKNVGALGRVWRLPGLPSFVQGVTRVRRRLVPLIDARSRLGLPEESHGARTCVVELEVSIPIALAVDSVEKLSPVDTHGTCSATRRSAGFYSPAVAQVVETDAGLCQVLDLEWIATGRSEDADATSDAVSQGHTRVIRDEPEAGTDARLIAATVARASKRAAPIQDLPALLRFCASPNQSKRNRSSVGARAEHLSELLAKPVCIGNRRIAGYRRGDPRLVAVAATLLEMPETFQTKEALPVARRLLGCGPDDYRVNHFRYDLRKFRTRYLAERIGTSRRYRLTGIGRIVCRALTQTHKVATVPDYQAA